MTIKVGINGFGRMGRLALRAAWDFPELEFVHINEPGGPVASAAHLLEFDSVHRRWNHDIQVSDGKMVVDGKPITYSSARDVGGGAVGTIECGTAAFAGVESHGATPGNR